MGKPGTGLHRFVQNAETSATLSWEDGSFDLLETRQAILRTAFDLASHWRVRIRVDLPTEPPIYVTA